MKKDITAKYKDQIESLIDRLEDYDEVDLDPGVEVLLHDYITIVAVHVHGRLATVFHIEKIESEVLDTFSLSIENLVSTVVYTDCDIIHIQLTI